MKAIGSAIFLSCLFFVSAPAAQAEAPQNAENGNTATGKKQPVKRFEPPYPFTVDELWAQMLKLAALPEGYVTRADVERTFSIKLSPLEQDPNRPQPPTYMVTHRDGDWYFTTGITEDSQTESTYFFAWEYGPYSPKQAPAGMCITPAMVESGMKATGWTFAERKIQHRDPFTGRPVPYKREERNYRKGDRGVLRVDIKQGCLIELSIMAEDHPHLEWIISD